MVAIARLTLDQRINLRGYMSAHYRNLNPIFTINMLDTIGDLCSYIHYVTNRTLRDVATNTPFVTNKASSGVNYCRKFVWKLSPKSDERMIDWKGRRL